MVVHIVLQIFPRDVACMSTMMTFEYLSQLCHNKEQIYTLPAAGLKNTAGTSQLYDSQMEFCFLFLFFK